jgi:hypothetical protein
MRCRHCHFPRGLGLGSGRIWLQSRRKVLVRPVFEKCQKEYPVYSSSKIFFALISPFSDFEAK